MVNEAQYEKLDKIRITFLFVLIIRPYYSLEDDLSLVGLFALEKLQGILNMSFVCRINQ